jgi:hypothetical protein
MVEFLPALRDAQFSGVDTVQFNQLEQNFRNDAQMMCSLSIVFFTLWVAVILDPFFAVPGLGIIGWFTSSLVDIL